MKEDLEKYLKPTYFCESNDPIIIETSKKITKKSDPRKLFEWVRDTYAWSVRKIVGAKGILKREHKEALCIDKTNLFIAICRAKGINTRYIIIKCDIKNKITGKDRIFHILAEVFFNEKWIIADPTFGSHTKAFIDISKFGKKTWLNVYKERRTASLPKYIPFFFNNFLIHTKSSKNLKNILDKIRI